MEKAPVVQHLTDLGLVVLATSRADGPGRQEQASTREAGMNLHSRSDAKACRAGHAREVARLPPASLGGVLRSTTMQLCCRFLITIV